MRCLTLRLLAGAAFLATCLPTLSAELTLDPSSELRCLSPAPERRTPVVYPDGLLQRKRGGTVEVELQFASPDRAPSMQVTAGSEWDGLVGAVSDHVKQLRVPCMRPGSDPVRVRFQFVFDPFDGRKVYFTRPVDLKDPERMAKRECLTHIGGQSRPHYSLTLRQAEVEGKVFVRLHFTSKDAPPRLEEIASENRDLTAEVRRYVDGLRLPCLGDEPLSWTVLYDFLFEDGNRVVLKDTSLVNLLRNAKLPPGPVRFDFDKMQCPFDLRITYRQPFAGNLVGQVGNTLEAREPLTDWLAGIEFKDIPTKMKTRILGEIFKVTVPCGSLEL